MKNVIVLKQFKNVACVPCTDAKIPLLKVENATGQRPAGLNKTHCTCSNQEMKY